MPKKPPPAEKRKVGRPPKPPGERVKIVSTSLPPDVVAHLVRIGGSESIGLRIAATEHYQRSNG